MPAPEQIDDFVAHIQCAVMVRLLKGLVILGMVLGCAHSIMKNLNATETSTEFVRFVNTLSDYERDRYALSTGKKAAEIFDTIKTLPELLTFVNSLKDKAHSVFSDQIKNRKMKKTEIIALWGKPHKMETLVKTERDTVAHFLYGLYVDETEFVEKWTYEIDKGFICFYFERFLISIE